MAKTKNHAADAAKTVELLWRSAASTSSVHGPRPSLTVDEILDAAIRLADADGLDAVTMRRVAEAMQVAPMSLYTYVPGKGELVELMLDTVYGRMPPYPENDPTWRARVTAVAEANRALFERHPWVSSITNTRPPLGPGLLGKYERELRAFDGIGLTDIEMDAALTFLLGFVTACARTVAGAKAEQKATGMTDDQWWAISEPLVTRFFDGEKYPIAARVGAAAGEFHSAAYNPLHAYEFGLQRILDGLDALIRSRKPQD